MFFQYDDTTGFFDVALTAAGGIDCGVGNGGILESAVWTSLFTDGLADPADLTPDLGQDRRGWWGDSGQAPSDSLARSLLWLFMRAKTDEATRVAIQNSCEDALQWMVDDGIFSALTVTVQWLAAPLEGVGIRIDAWEPSGVQRNWQQDLVWSGIAS
jgi:phage gp46-like protein